MSTDRISLSWSMLKTWENCHQQVLRRQEKKSSYNPKQGRIFLPGTIADRCMRNFLDNDPQEGGICDTVEEMFEKYAFNDDQYTINWRGNPREDQEKVKENVRLVLNNLEPMLWDLVIPFGYETAWRFRVTVGIPDLAGNMVPVDLIGETDLLTATIVDEVPEEYAVYDLKATFDDSYARGGTLAQLIFYSIAVKAKFGKYPTKSAFLTPACKQRYVPLEISPDDIRIMMTRIVSYCHGVMRNDWAPKDEPDGDCTWCDVKHSCDLFRLEPGKKVSFLEMASRRTSK